MKQGLDFIIRNRVMKRNKNKVVCFGCTYLVGLCNEPKCIQKIKFVQSALLKAIDVVGLESPQIKNRKNNCKHKKLFDIHTIKFKLWLRNYSSKEGMDYYGSREAAKRYQN